MSHALTVAIQSLFIDSRNKQSSSFFMICIALAGHCGNVLARCSSICFSLLSEFGADLRSCGIDLTFALSSNNFMIFFQMPDAQQSLWYLLREKIMKWPFVHKFCRLPASYAFTYADLNIVHHTSQDLTRWRKTRTSYFSIIICDSIAKFIDCYWLTSC